MKKVLWLSGILLCASGIYADASHPDPIAEGRKRNEDLYERTLEQTGWINQKVSKQDNNTESPRTPQSRTPSPSKSS